MGSADIKSMDLRLGGNPFPTAQQRLQEANTSFSLPIPSPSKLNRPSQPQPYQHSFPSISGSNITEFDLAANVALQAANHTRPSLGGSSPLKRSMSYAGSSTHNQSSQSSGLSLQSPYTSSQSLSQYHLASASYPLAPLSENIDHARSQAEKRDLKTPKRASLQPPAPIQRSFSQPSYSAKDAPPLHIPSSPADGDCFDFEAITDDGSKPPYSYAHLIGMAILRSPQKRLTLNQIYTWITTTFEYYRAEAQPQTNWQNSIRHNLSLNKAFIKEERPKDEPGKGHYWKIVPGAEAQFAKGSKGRRPLNPHRNSTGSMPPPISSQAQMASAAALAFHSMPMIDEPIRVEPIRVAQDFTSRQRANSISSNDGQEQRSPITTLTKLPVFEMEPPSNPSFVQPRLQDSPILPPSMDTPPPSQDIKGNRKRKSFRDSGYFGTPDGPEFFSHDAFKLSHPDQVEEDDIPSQSTEIKRPRLDATLSESRIIAKPPPHSFHNLSIISPPPSSSPQRPFSARKAIFTTPRAQITRLDAPPTCSPQTRLQLHREDINRYLSSPAKSVIFESSFDDPYLDFEKSPAKFHEGPDDVVLRYAYGSPAKRETKRRNYWRRLHSGFDPADIEGEVTDATEVYGVDLGYIYRASMQNEGDVDNVEVNEKEDEEDPDYVVQEESESDSSSDGTADNEAEVEADGDLTPIWGQEHEEGFGENLSP